MWLLLITYRVITFGEHCETQTNREGRSVFRTTKEGHAAFKEEVSAPRKTLINAGLIGTCTKCREGV